MFADLSHRRSARLDDPARLRLLLGRGRRRPVPGQRLRQRSSFMIVMRVIPFSVPTPEALGLPDDADSARRSAATGWSSSPGRAGRARPRRSRRWFTTSIAASIVTYSTLEDPIEYLHRDLSSSVTQREVGIDTDDVASGLRAALRQDPDVIVIGDLREADAIDRAIRAAESECLVLAAVSAPDLMSTLLQLLASFPTDEREVGRIRFAAVAAGSRGAAAGHQGAWRSPTGGGVGRGHTGAARCRGRRG